MGKLRDLNDFRFGRLLVASQAKTDNLYAMTNSNHVGLHRRLER